MQLGGLRSDTILEFWLALEIVHVAGRPLLAPVRAAPKRKKAAEVGEEEVSRQAFD